MDDMVRGRRRGSTTPSHRVFARRDDRDSAALKARLRELHRHAQPADEGNPVEHRYRALFETSRDGIFVADAETGILLDVNPAGERLVGRPASQLIGQHQRVLHPARDAARYEHAFRHVTAQQQALTDEDLFVVRPDGTEVPVEIATATFRQNGRYVIQGVFRDVTARHERASAMQVAVGQLTGALANAPVGLCLIDRVGRIRRPNLTLIQLAGTTANELNGIFAWALVRPQDADVVKHKIDTLLSQRCEHFLAHSNLVGSEAAVLLHGGRFDDPHRPTTGAILLVQDLREVKAAHAEAENQRQRAMRGLAEMTLALARTIEKRDPYTSGHQARVARVSIAIAEMLGLPHDQIRGIEVGAQLHDIGKISIPSEILTYPGRLDHMHMALIRQHPKTGFDIVKDIETPWRVGEIILQHHERLDGSGYPDGLTGDAICLEARIVAVADVIEAITSHRPYRAALGVDAALHDLQAGKGRLYDPRVVDACVSLAADGQRWARLLDPDD